MDQGLQPDGKIILVDHREREVTVRFDGRKIVCERNYFTWNGVQTFNVMYRIDGILHHPHTVLFDPCLLVPGGDTDTISFDDLEGTWSSSEGGEGRYLL